MSRDTVLISDWSGAGVQGPELARPQDQEQGRHPLQTQGHQHQRTLSPHENSHNVNIFSLFKKIFYVENNSRPSGETWRGKWQGNEIAAKILALRECTPRISRDFNEEYPKLRIFSHPNVLPVIGCCNSPPNLVVISQYMPVGRHSQRTFGEDFIIISQRRRPLLGPPPG